MVRGRWFFVVAAIGLTGAAIASEPESAVTWHGGPAAPVLAGAFLGEPSAGSGATPGAVTPGQPKGRGADVRIGSPRQGAQDVALDFDQATGNLFAVVGWNDPTHPFWRVNISTDDGASWSETTGVGGSSLFDAAVVDQFVYVAYSNEDYNVLRMSRFFVADGTMDMSYGGGGLVNVAIVDPNTILDIAVGANADAQDNRIYVAFIESNHAVRFFWDVADDGTTWAEMSPSPSLVSAASGLDYHWGGGTLGSDPNRLWLSCLGTDGYVHFLAAAASGSWNHYFFSFTPYPNQTRTRISAYGNYVVVAYTAAGTNAAAPFYLVSYNNGTTWFSGFAYDPPTGAPGCFGVDVTARGGWGTGIIYNSESSFDTVSVATREDYAQGSPWNPPFTFNEVDAFSGSPSFIQYLRPLGAFGMVYLAGDTAGNVIPYFDFIALMPFDDGFEFGDTSAWSDIVP